MLIGIDLVQISEFQKRLDSAGGLELVFLDSELKDNPRPENLAGVFAAKESFMKALGRKTDWRQVWIEKEESGRPVLQSTALRQDQKAEVSISHAGEYAIAVVFIL